MSSLSISELNNSLYLLLKLVQGNDFSQEIKSIKQSKPISHKSKLILLNPFLDDDGLLRVGG